MDPIGSNPPVLNRFKICTFNRLNRSDNLLRWGNKTLIHCPIIRFVLAIHKYYVIKFVFVRSFILRLKYCLKKIKCSALSLFQLLIPKINNSKNNEELHYVFRSSEKSYNLGCNVFYAAYSSLSIHYKVKCFNHEILLTSRLDLNFNRGRVHNEVGTENTAH